MTLIKDYFDLTKKYIFEYGEKTILLMQVGAFYEVYGIRNKNTDQIRNSQIQDFSKICELNIVDKNICITEIKKDESIVMAGFKDIMIDKYIKKLQEAGYTIVVYTQDEQTKNTSRNLAGIFSPGTYFNSDQDACDGSNSRNKLTNNTMCIWIESIETKLIEPKGKFIMVGISNIDIYTGKTTLYQYKETYIHNPTTYDELEKFVSIYEPTEVIIISNLPSQEIEDIISFSNIKSLLIHKISLVSANGNTNINEFTKKARNCEKQVYQKEVIERFYNINDFGIFMQNFYDNSIATQSFCFLLDFIYQHNPYLVHKISEPSFENCSDRLLLANHSLRQLNIIDNDYHGAFSSVEKLLNLCLTPMGKRKFSYDLLNPSKNIEFLRGEYDITDYLLSLENTSSRENVNVSDVSNGSIRSKLSKIKDISKWNRQLHMKKITPNSLYQLYKNIKTTREIFDIVSKDKTICEYLNKHTTYKNVKMDCIGSYCSEIMEFLDFHLDIESCNDLDQYVNFDTNFIKKGIDSNLDNATVTMTDSLNKLESIRVFLNNLLEKYEKKSKATEYIKLHETEKNNYSLLATKRRCTILKEALKTVANQPIMLQYNSEQCKEFEFEFIIVDKDKDKDKNKDKDKDKDKDTAKKEKGNNINVDFLTQSTANNSIVNPVINELCKNISTMKVQFKEILNNAYASFINKFVSTSENGETYPFKIEFLIHFITKIDVLYNKVFIVNKYGYCKPEIDETSDKSFASIKGIRHCLIEHLQQNELYVSNDVTIGKDETDGVDGMLLYGTNAVGKTSFIRAVGIAVIMAQAGLYVPCSKFVYKPYDSIFTRILGNDNIFKGLSTFAVEMSELRTILKLTTKNSLVLGDELCSGTESVSAISIFVAGIQYLSNAKSSFLFATHLHEIVNYDEITNMSNVGLFHMSVIYDREKDILVYDRKLKRGPGTSMYGLEVCKSLNLPNDFLEMANQIRMKYHPNMGSALSLQQSNYNSNILVSICKMCNKNMATETHHLQHQMNANSNGIIISQTDKSTKFHKNHPANLLTICESCHKGIHKEKKQHARKKTSNGIILINM
jgi:DNA mismatch repair protein MutS